MGANAVIYARYSSDEQREESITAQLRACYDYAQKNGLTITGEYIDRATSAKHDNIKNRHEFQRMITAAKRREFDVLLVHKYNRFARSRYDHAIYNQLLKEHNIILIAVAEYFGTGKEAILAEGLLQSLSEYFIVDLSEETKKGLRENAEQALHNGGYPPFGYDVKNKKYIINQTEAIYVRKMFSTCLNGDKYNDLIAEMNAAGIRGKRGKPMKYTSIYEILRNEKYTGTYTYCSTESNIRRDKSNAIRIENAFPAIIDHETWERVQKIMDKRKNNGRNPKHDYLLTGLITCGECGASMYGLTSKREKNGNLYVYSYYTCSHKCGNSNIKSEIAEKAVFDYLRSLLTDENRIVLQDAIMKYQLQIKQQKDFAQQEIKKEISDREKKINTLMQNMSAAVLPAAVLSNIGAEIEALNHQIEVLTLELSHEGTFDKKQITKYFDAVCDIENQTPENQKKFIRRFIENVEIKKNSINVTSTFTEFLKNIGCGSRI